MNILGVHFFGVHLETAIRETENLSEKYTAMVSCASTSTIVDTSEEDAKFSVVAAIAVGLTL